MNTITRLLIHAGFAALEKRVEQALSSSNSEVSVFVRAIFAIFGETIELLTDNDPNDKAQLSALLLRCKHSLLKLALTYAGDIIDGLPDDNVKSTIIEALHILQKEL